MLGGVFGIYCQGPFWASGVVAAMNPGENALALGLPAGVSLAGALLLAYVILASPLTAHWTPRKRAVVFAVVGSSVLVACAVAARFAGHVVSRKLQSTETPSNQPLDPTAPSLRVFDMITVPASQVSPERALGRRAVAQRGRLAASLFSSHDARARWSCSSRPRNVSSRFPRGISAVSTSTFSPNPQGLMATQWADTLTALPDSRSVLIHFWLGSQAATTNEATPVNAPTAPSFQVQRPYRRVPEQRR
jgi:hypothetical protein